jgi:hypothetical protein
VQGHSRVALLPREGVNLAPWRDVTMPENIMDAVQIVFRSLIPDRGAGKHMVRDAT